MLVCIFRLHYEFERVFPSSFFGILINYGHILIFISLSSFTISIEISIFNSWLILGHYLFFFLFFSISSKLLSSICFYPTSGHNISCLMVYLSFVILISFILHQKLYLLFNLIKFINLLFLLYLISIMIMRGQYLSNFSLWFSFINPINCSTLGTIVFFKTKL